MISYKQDKVYIHGHKLRALRKEKKISIRLIAEKCGLTHQNISLIETKSKTITIEKIKNIARVLSISLSDLYSKKIIAPIPNKPPAYQKKLRAEYLPGAKVDIFKYDTVSDYLKAWYTKNKKIEFHFSHRLIQRKLQLASISTFTDILAGKKRLSKKQLDLLTEWMGLNSQEKEYLFVSFWDGVNYYPAVMATLR